MTSGMSRWAVRALYGIVSATLAAKRRKIGAAVAAVRLNPTVEFLEPRQLLSAGGIEEEAPANDNFANRTVLEDAPLRIFASNAEATMEVGEPNHAGENGGHSVWWTWTAPNSGQVQIDTIGSHFDTLLAIYTGESLNGLTEVASADEGGGMGTSKVTFTATQGTVYLIAVDGYEGEFGTIVLNISDTAAPANDDFADATPLTGLYVKVNGSNANATKETGEPDHYEDKIGGHSVWWSWTAPIDGQIRIDTIGSSFDTLLAVYTGESVDDLTQVASDDQNGGLNTSKLEFEATEGITYYIAVDGDEDKQGAIVLSITDVTRPVNDNFADRIVLTGLPASTMASNISATREDDDPILAGDSGGHSLWWSWTPTTTQYVQIDTIGSDFDTIMGVFTGTTLSGLVLVKDNDDNGAGSASVVRFVATAGVPYQIVVDGFDGSSGQVVLNISAALQPANDNFADRETIPGQTASLTANNGNATRETNEPLHAGRTGGASLWWTWTAAAAGQVNLSTYGSKVDTLLAVYTGDALASLVLVAANDNFNGMTSFVSFMAKEGTVYQFAVDTRNAQFGELTLALTQAPPPPANDNFADAAYLEGYSVALTELTNLGATPELGEPAHAGQTGGRSVWWTWTAPATGRMTLSTIGSEIDTLLAVYTGNSVGELTELAANDDQDATREIYTSRVVFDTVAGMTYRFAVDGLNGDNGEVALSFELVPFPSAITSFAATPGNGQVGLSWANPTDSVGVVILRSEGQAPSASPVHGTPYTLGDEIGNATVIYVGSGTSFLDTGLTNDTTYYYAAYTFNSADLYSAASSASASPVDPNAITVRGDMVLHVGTSRTVSTITISDSARVNLLPSGDLVLRTGSLLISDQGTLDLGNNILVIQATSATRNDVLQQVTAWILAARNNGAWDQPGLTSSRADARTTLAAMLNDLGGGKLAMPGEDPNAIIVKYTYYGDVNLDGSVNLSDYFTIDSGYLNQRQGFANGDMNYDGEINLNDYFLIDSAYLNQTTPLSAGVAATAAVKPSTAKAILTTSKSQKRRAAAKVKARRAVAARSPQPARFNAQRRITAH